MPKRPEKGLHYLVEFASRYARSPFQTLTASAALWRAEELAYDARALLELREAGERKEWHARSRLVDLMMFQPGSIETSDVKNIASLAISQMVSEGATIPHLLGAATRVSELTEYLDIFVRIFRNLDIKVDLEKQLRGMPVAIDTHSMDDDLGLFRTLDRLFITRNHLVHEIDQSIIGHFSIRDTWSALEAIQYAEAVITAIKEVELHITVSAPKDFPNRLNEDGTEEDELKKLSDVVANLEAQLTTEIARCGDNEVLWNEALAASRGNGLH